MAEEPAGNSEQPTSSKSRPTALNLAPQSPPPTSPPPHSGSVRSFHTFDSSPAKTGTHSGGGWDAIRRRVLPTTPAQRQWPTLGPNGDLTYPSTMSQSGRSSPTFSSSGRDRDGGLASGRSTPTLREGGFARLMGAARKRKEPIQQSLQDRFAGELAQVEEIYGVGLLGYASTSGLGHARRGSGAGGKGNQNPAHPRPGDPEGALQFLDTVLERYRGTRTLPDQTRVLLTLARPFRTGNLRAARMALNGFKRMDASHKPGDSEECMERWKWLLRSMEMEDDEIRSQLAELIAKNLTPLAYPDLWSITIPPLTFQSLLSSLLRLLHLLSTSPRMNPIHLSPIRKITHQLLTGELFTADSLQFAQLLAVPSHLFDGRSPSSATRLIAFNALLVVLLESEVEFGAWLLEDPLMQESWPAEIAPGLALHFTTLVGKIARPLLPRPNDKIDDIFSPTPSSFSTPIKSSLSGFLSSRTPLNPSTPLRTQTVYAFLAFFSDFERNETREIKAAKDFVSQSWIADKASVVEAVRMVNQELEIGALGSVMRMCLLGLKEEISAGIANSCLASLFERIRHEPASDATRPLIPLLRLLASRHPTSFFKPLFALSSSCTPTSLATVMFLSELLGPTSYLLKDPEMMAVALMGKGKSKLEAVDDSGVGDSGEGWEKVRLGQLCLVVELIWVLRKVRDNQDVSRLERDNAQRFAEAFEGKLSVFVQSQEQKALLPFSLRILLSRLFFELRRLSRPSHRPIWLPRLLIWTNSSTPGTSATLEAKTSSNPFLDNRPHILVTHSTLSEITQSLSALRRVLAKHSTRLELIEEWTSVGTELDPLAAELKLLVAVSHKLGEHELGSIVEVVWEALDGTVEARFEPACFLLTLCAEHAPAALNEVISKDMNSPSTSRRKAVVLRLASLFGARFNILSQEVAERSRKAPFKLGRQQISFVPIEVGVPSYVAVDLPEEAKLQLGASLPPEVRKALAEMGWDERSEEQTFTERQRRPMSLLPWTEISSEVASDRPPSPVNQGEGGTTLRRSSSTGSNRSSTSGANQKSAVTPPISVLLLRIVEMLQDSSVAVRLLAQDTLLTFLRDDPVSLLQPLFVDLTGKLELHPAATYKIRQLLTIRSSLPPSAAHTLFNYIGGLIKSLSREGTQAHFITTAALVFPIAADLAPLVSELSIREFRKNKVEPLFLSTGSFWSDGDGSRTHLVPRQAPAVDRTPFIELALDSVTFQVAMIRLSQNMLAANHLARSVLHEAFSLKKLLQTLRMPTLDHLPDVLEVKSFLPKVVDSIRTPKQQEERNLCSLVARSWLLISIQLLRGLSRYSNVKEELAVVFDGISRILLVHGDDANIVGLALRACILASTRFRRLFSSGSGFSLFVPALFHVYFASSQNAATRSSIEYACQRFYRHHSEAFVFSALTALSPLFLKAEDEVARQMGADLFKVLQSLSMHSIDAVDVAGIRGTNETEEREALIHAANERPDVFLAGFRDTNNPVRLATALGAETKPFSVESAIKLFLTSIAYDPTTTRAGEFLLLFRLLVPSFWLSSDKVKALLREGVESLATIFLKSGTRGRSTRLKADVGHQRDAVDADPRTSLDKEPPGSVDDLLEASHDDDHTWISTRASYLLLVEAYLASGGELGPSSTLKVFEIARGILGDNTTVSCTASVSTFLGTYSDTIMGPKSASTKPAVLAFVQSIIPFVRLHLHLDFRAVFQNLARLALDPTFQDETVLTDLVVGGVITPVLDACGSLDDTSHFKWYSAGVSLVANWLTHPRANLVRELERQPTRPAFLGTFVFPLVVAFDKASIELVDIPSRRHHLKVIWLHLLAYLMRVGRDHGSRSLSPTTLLACQILKLVLILNDDSLSLLFGWLKISNFFQELFPQREGLVLRRNGTEISTTEFAKWSLFEFLAQFPSPLLPHLRLLIRENLIAHRPHSHIPYSLSRPASMVDTTRPRSIYATKPLLSRSASRSKSGGGVLPKPRSPSRTSGEASRTRPYFDRSILDTPPQYTPEPTGTPSFSGDRPRIQHLGPVSLSHRPDLNLSPKLPEALIRSPVLIRKTAERIKLVQIVFGESPAVAPESLGEEEGEEMLLKGWSKEQALANIEMETRLLLEEFVSWEHWAGRNSPGS